MSTAEAALEGTNAVALPVLASTLTTMAVLLPVVLLAGLAALAEQVDPLEDDLRLYSSFLGHLGH